MIVALVCATSISQAGTDDAKLGIRLRIKREAYSLGSNIELEIVRENIGHNSVLVPRWWGWGATRTDILMFDASGHEVRTDFLADELPPLPQPYDFVLLDPGQFVGTRLTGRAKEFVNKPGDYVFVVEYTSYLSEDYARQLMKMPDVPFWSRERGPVTSNKIRVHITR